LKKENYNTAIYSKTPSLTKQIEWIKKFYFSGKMNSKEIARNLYKVYKSCGGKRTFENIIKKGVN